MADNVVNPSVAPPNGVKSADLSAYQARLRAAFVETLTEDDLRAIARKLTEQAREGDRTSARLVLKYGLGNVIAEREPKRSGAATGSAKPDAESAAFLAYAAQALRELDALEAEARRQAAAGRPRPGGPPPGTARR